MIDFVVVIPARYASTRLPGKPLREINGKPMIEHVYQRGRESGARDVVIATDDQRIADAADRFGATVCMTGDQHRSGTERIAEVADLMEDFGNPNVVKVVLDNSGFAIYFSRATIPYPRDAARLAEARAAALHHHGIYAYRCGVLRRLVASEPSALELAEHLEQLRALSLGMTIRVGVPAVRPGAGVDTEEDLAKAARELAVRR